MKLKNYTRSLFMGSIFIFYLFVSTNTAFASCREDNGVYAQLSSLVTQIPGIDKRTVIMENIDEISGLIFQSNEQVVVRESGLYFVMVSGRVGSDKITLFGSLDLFLMKNGNIIPHSYVNYDVASRVATSTLVSQTVLPLKKGDSISVGISSDSPSLGLIGVLSPIKKIPSLIFTMYKVN